MNWIGETLSYLKLEYCCGDENNYDDYYIINSEKPTLYSLQEIYTQISKEKLLKERQSQIQKLLLESDYIELPSFLERKGQEIYNQWMTYRANLRLAYHDTTLPLPEAPQ